MLIDTVASFFTGLGVSLAVGSPVEWGVHKYILHATPKSRRRIKFVNDSTHGHNDKHHGAYKGPAHYYRDITNEHEVIHFAKSDVGVIAGCSAIVGGIMDASYSVLAQKSLSPSINDAAFVSGVVSGSMVYYGCYEFVHHYMHVIGQRRLEINRVLGDEIQGGTEKRDGNLRFSKPLLDDVCNQMEFQLDRNYKRKKPEFHFEDSLIQRLERQIGYNLERQDISQPNMSADSDDALEVLHVTTNSLLERERNYRDSLNTGGKIKNLFGRRIQKNLRVSPLFQYIDNNHFIHHYKYGKNLNVVFPISDIIFGTKEDSTISTLEENRRYWLCPNSPDVQPFVVREPKRKSA